MAGGGIQGGKVIGATNEIGLRAVEDKVHVHDLHATILPLLGLDHQKLTYHFQGRDYRLTNVYGQNNLAAAADAGIRASNAPLWSRGSGVLRTLKSRVILPPRL